MVTRDKDGNYVNDAGVTIKISEYEGGIKMDFYDKSPREDDHKSIHTHINEDGTYRTEDNINGEIEKSSGACYLTTACMMHLQEDFDDNCEELTVLRWFRDNFVSKEDIEHYYSVAPTIVSTIDELENADDINLIYNYIYENVVSYCVEAVKNNNFNEAYKRYKTSILFLEEKFSKPIKYTKFTKLLKTKIKRYSKS